MRIAVLAILACLMLAGCPPPQPPIPPPVTTTITVTWPLSIDDAELSEYYVYRALGNVATGGVFVQVGTVAAHQGAYVDQAVDLTQAYTYEIRAYGCFASGCIESPASKPGFYTPGATMENGVVRIH